MTKAPTTIWAWPHAERGWYSAGASNEINFGLAGIEAELQTEYVSRSHCESLVAAAYEDAASLLDPRVSETRKQEFSLPHLYEEDQALIRNRVPADAKTAYNAAIAKARADALREAFAAVQSEYLDWKGNGFPSEALAIAKARDEIHALIPETSHD